MPKLGNTGIAIIFLSVFNLINMVYKPFSQLKLFYFLVKLSITNDILKNLANLRDCAVSKKCQEKVLKELNNSL